MKFSIIESQRDEEEQALFASKFQFSNLILSVILVGFFLFSANQVQAAGLVPCGGCIEYNADGTCKTSEPACQICHLFKMIVDVYNWVITYLVFPIGTLMIVIGGFMFFFTGGDPQKVKNATAILTSAIIGLVIIFGAWIIISSLLNAIDVVKIENIMTPWNVNTLCPIQ